MGPTNMELERLLSPKELAEATGLQLSWIYQKVEAGDIPALKLGRYVRFRPSEVAAWLDAQRLTVVNR